MTVKERVVSALKELVAKAIASFSSILEQKSDSGRVVREFMSENKESILSIGQAVATIGNQMVDICSDPIKYEIATIKAVSVVNKLEEIARHIVSAQSQFYSTVFDEANRDRMGDVVQEISPVIEAFDAFRLSMLKKELAALIKRRDRLTEEGKTIHHDKTFVCTWMDRDIERLQSKINNFKTNKS
jgi:hypothetical protein